MNNILTIRRESLLEQVLAFHDRWEGEVTDEFREVFSVFVIEGKPHPLVHVQSR